MSADSSTATDPASVTDPPGKRAPIRILIVDDHTLLREGLRDILEAEDDITVVGEAGNGREAIRCVVAGRPDVVVLDVGIPGDDVTATVSAIQRASPGADILILSIYDDAALVRELLGMGVRGYLLKSVTRQDFVTAVRGVRRDRQLVVLSISRQSLQQVNGAGTMLSRREREIMAMVADAMSNSQIARRLSIAEGTVKRHLRNIFAKLGAVSRIDAVNKAVATQQLPPMRRGGEFPR